MALAANNSRGAQRVLIGCARLRRIAENFGVVAADRGPGSVGAVGRTRRKPCADDKPIATPDRGGDRDGCSVAGEWS
jgi:hypothetical protein